MSALLKTLTPDSFLFNCVYYCRTIKGISIDSWANPSGSGGDRGGGGGAYPERRQCAAMEMKDAATWIEDAATSTSWGSDTSLTLRRDPPPCIRISRERCGMMWAELCPPINVTGRAEPIVQVDVETLIMSHHGTIADAEIIGGQHTACISAHVARTALLVVADDLGDIWLVFEPKITKKIFLVFGTSLR
ncbi:hypothetical protein GGX14DRAFT_406508 [Mycena pura]|uniref:Uncharacterized protein n=1 Tax=Mycena pura TaxID=153505 RepID=A0AAD6UTY3_9AGAR|nr:hypothetical protein GGX14DRAFT_406508 [Mycena pura]